MDKKYNDYPNIIGQFLGVAFLFIKINDGRKFNEQCLF